MLTGQWKEANAECIKIDIVDENITQEGKIVISTSPQIIPTSLTITILLLIISQLLMQFLDHCTQTT